MIVTFSQEQKVVEVVVNHNSHKNLQSVRSSTHHYEGTKLNFKGLLYVTTHRKVMIGRHIVETTPQAGL